MKSLRRLRDRVAASVDAVAASPGDPDGATDPAGTPPAGAVVAAYAAVLDGAHLWVAVDDRPGRLAVRDTATGRLLAAAPDGPADDPSGYLSAVLPLDEVTVGTDHDVVVVSTDPATAHPVWAARLPASGTPPAADGRSRVVLDRAADGTLRLRRDALPVTAVLRTVSVRDDGVELRLDDPAASLAVLGTAVDGQEPLVVARSVDEVLLLTDAPLRDLPTGPVRLVAVTAGDVRPVRRHADDLVDPGRAVPLPELRDAATDLPRLRLRWDADGHLAARVLDGEEDA